MPRGNYIYGPGFWKNDRYHPGWGRFGSRHPFAPGRGRGLGLCRQWAAVNYPAYPVTAREEADLLKEHAEVLRAELDDIQNYIEDLEKRNTTQEEQDN